MNTFNTDELALVITQACVTLFEVLEDRHEAEPMICMTAKTNRGKYTIKIIRENNENDEN